MKTLLIAATIFTAAAAAMPAMAQTTVSINLGQPNFYGPLDMGGFAPPPVYSRQPIIIERQVRYVGQPVYLRVPEGHRKHWDKHCREYNACGQQVFFVQDGWYNNTYAPRYREQRRPVAVRQPQYREEHRRDERHEERHEERGHDDRGHGNGHDNGNGHGNGNGNGHGKHGD